MLGNGPKSLYTSTRNVQECINHFVFMMYRLTFVIKNVNYLSSCSFSAQAHKLKPTARVFRLVFLWIVFIWVHVRVIILLFEMPRVVFAAPRSPGCWLVALTPAAIRGAVSLTLDQETFSSDTCSFTNQAMQVKAFYLCSWRITE